MSMSGARVLVTGASGFLGGYVVPELQRHGYEVFAAGRNEQALARVVDDRHRILGDLASLRARDLPVDAVIHCAALSTPWGPWKHFREVNVDGTGHVVEFAHRNQVRRVVHVSSPSVYAAPRDRIGIREPDVDRSNRLNGYIRSKIAAEDLLLEALDGGTIGELVIVRPRGLIGVGDPSLVPRLLDVHARIGAPIFDGGDNLIDVTAVENVASALRSAVTRGDPAGGVYNITNDDPRRFRELLTILLERMGETPRFRPMNRRAAWTLASALEGVCAVLPGRPEPPLTRYTLSTIAYSQTLDITRAKAELGYHPEVSLDDALASVAAHLKAST
jgi:nucleoside-diphosphate-sugar epimerase